MLGVTRCLSWLQCFFVSQFFDIARTNQIIKLWNLKKTCEEHFCDLDFSAYHHRLNSHTKLTATEELSFAVTR
jgi:hypothetical protein